MQTHAIVRSSIEVDGRRASFLTAGEGRPVLLLHGTWWSRVWRPVMHDLAEAGLRPIAVDLPGCGCSEGRLTLRTATVPNLADWVSRFRRELLGDEPGGLAGYDLGGAIAQHITVHRPYQVDRLALVNSGTYGSWPVSNVARFRDPELVAATTTAEILKAPPKALPVAMARPVSADEEAEYLAPRLRPDVARSWMTIAGAADSRSTQDLVEGLKESQIPKHSIWGEGDVFQLVSFAERFAMRWPTLRSFEIRRRVISRWRTTPRWSRAL